MSRRTVIIFTILISCSLFFSCSQEPPEIIQNYWQLTVVNNVINKTRYEELSLFLHVIDPDGIEDIESVYLIHDDSELFWKLEKQNWETYNNQDEQWLGSNAIVLNDYADFPRGTYRIIVIDATGERDKTEIFIGTETINKRQIPVPTAEVQKEVINIKSDYTQNSLRIYRDENRHLKTVKTEAERLEISAAFTNRDEQRLAAELYVYAFNSEYGVGVVSGPYYF